MNIALNPSSSVRASPSSVYSLTDKNIAVVELPSADYTEVLKNLRQINVNLNQNLL